MDHKLDAKYTFSLAAELSRGQADTLRDVPGVSVWRSGGGLTVPFNAGWIVAATLDAWRIAYRATLKGGITSDRTFEQAWQDAVDGGRIPATLDAWLVPFQRDVIRARWFTGGGSVWAPGGAGKTAMMLTLSALWNVPTVFVGPAKALGQWEQEASAPYLAGPNASFYAWRPDSSMRKKDSTIDEYLSECAEKNVAPRIYVTWTLEPDRVDRLIKLVAGVGAVFFDEAHTAKNPDRLDWSITYDEHGNEQFASTAKDTRTANAWRLAKCAKYRIAATATPISIGVVDLWGQLTLAEPDAWGKTATRFKKRYADMIPGPYGGMVPNPAGVGYAHVDELRGRVAFTRSLVSIALTHAQLPARRRRVVLVPRSEQNKAAGAWAREMKALQKEHGQAAELQLAELHRARAASMKRGFAVDRIVDAVRCGQTVLAFTGRKLDCAQLSERVAKKLKVAINVVAPDDGVSHRVWTAHGDDSPDVRETIRQSYMSFVPSSGGDKVRGGVLIGTWHAWGESLNLHNTDLHLFVMIPGTPREVMQGEARSYRLGMKRPVLVEYLIAEGTYDERVWRTLLSRIPLVEELADGAAVDGFRAALADAGDEEAAAADFLDYLAGLDLGDDTGDGVENADGEEEAG